MSQNLVQRIAFAAVAIPLAAGLIRLGGWPLAAALAALGVLGTREIYDFARRQHVTPLAAMGYVSAAGIPLAAFWGNGWALYLGAAWLMALLAAAMVLRGPSGRPLVAVAVTVFGALYASALLAFLIPIRHGAHSAARPAAYTWLVLFPLALTWLCDTGAMAAGAAFGGPKLAPVLSPHKTWAGAIGGTVVALAAALLAGKLVLNRVGWEFGAGQLAVVGLVVALTAQTGDVAESLFKREAGLKDSSALIPGHGGVLDRLDSLYFVVPASAGLFKLFGVI